MAPKQ